jgi:hypothetical protein
MKLPLVWAFGIIHKPRINCSEEEGSHDLHIDSSVTTAAAEEEGLHGVHKPQQQLQHRQRGLGVVRDGKSGRSLNSYTWCSGESAGVGGGRCEFKPQPAVV